MFTMSIKKTARVSICLCLSVCQIVCVCVCVCVSVCVSVCICSVCVVVDGEFTAWTLPTPRRDVL